MRLLHLQCLLGAYVGLLEVKEAWHKVAKIKRKI